MYHVQIYVHCEWLKSVNSNKCQYTVNDYSLLVATNALQCEWLQSVSSNKFQYTVNDYSLLVATNASIL